MSNLLSALHSDVSNLMDEMQDNHLLGMYLIPKIYHHIDFLDCVDLPGLEVSIADFTDDVRAYLEMKIDGFMRDLRKREVISFESKCE